MKTAAPPHTLDHYLHCVGRIGGLTFKESGDSNVTFAVTFRAADVGAQYLLRHEFVKALCKRFRADGTDTSYPVRKLVWDPRGESAASEVGLTSQLPDGPVSGVPSGEIDRLR